MNLLTSSYLEIILGPMFSGKTTRLLEMYKKYKLCNIPIIVINHSLDNRYHETLLSTHDKKMIPCIQRINLLDNISIFEEYQVILINEGQFFDDIVPFTKQMLDYNKTIYICGLDGDFERNKFGNLLDLIPLCDNVMKLKSLCALCKNGNYAIFSRRLSNEKEQTIIGSDNYIPVCRSCYNNEK